MLRPCMDSNALSIRHCQQNRTAFAMHHNAFSSSPVCNAICITVPSSRPRNSCHGNRSCDSSCGTVLESMADPNLLCCCRTFYPCTTRWRLCGWPAICPHLHWMYALCLLLASLSPQCECPLPDIEMDRKPVYTMLPCSLTCYRLVGTQTGS